MLISKYFNKIATAITDVISNDDNKILEYVYLIGN